MASEDEEIFLLALKQAGKRGTKAGVKVITDNDDVATFVARQFSFTFDLLKKGAKLSPANLAVLLAEKSMSIAALGLGDAHKCAVSVILLSLSLTKTAALTTFTGPAHLAFKAIEILADCYSTDKACGVSDKVRKTVDNALTPAAGWLERGVIETLNRGHL